MVQAADKRDGGEAEVWEGGAGAYAAGGGVSEEGVWAGAAAHTQTGGESAQTQSGHREPPKGLDCWERAIPGQTAFLWLSVLITRW